MMIDKLVFKKSTTKERIIVESSHRGVDDYRVLSLFIFCMRPRQLLFNDVKQLFGKNANEYINGFIKDGWVYENNSLIRKEKDINPEILENLFFFFFDSEFDYVVMNTNIAVGSMDIVFNFDRHSFVEVDRNAIQKETFKRIQNVLADAKIITRDRQIKQLMASLQIRCEKI